MGNCNVQKCITAPTIMFKNKVCSFHKSWQVNSKSKHFGLDCQWTEWMRDMSNKLIMSNSITQNSCACKSAVSLVFSSNNRCWATLILKSGIWNWSLEIYLCVYCVAKWFIIRHWHGCRSAFICSRCLVWFYGAWTFSVNISPIVKSVQFRSHFIHIYIYYFSCNLERKEEFRIQYSFLLSSTSIYSISFHFIFRLAQIRYFAPLN